MFTIVGERLNTSRKPVKEAVRQRDAAFVAQEARRQVDAGAHWIEVNAGTFGEDEQEHLFWLMDVVAKAVDAPMAVDSASPATIAQALERSDRTVMVNSISLETNRFEPVLTAVEGKNCHLVALCMNDAGMPRDAEEVVDRAVRLVEGIESTGIPRDRIHVDPLIQPVATDASKGVMAMDSIRGIHQRLPGVNTLCGLSNISFGMPQRKAINRCFLALLLSAGLTGAILDPLDTPLMSMMMTGKMLLAKDPYCMGYVKAAQAGKIV
ncbi:MAG: dihydropteroate synthase [Proteobacteria bacterium]|nr:dihydropteroate synthase [Pseudomonadota bacterium]